VVAVVQSSGGDRGVIVSLCTPTRSGVRSVCVQRGVTSLDVITSLRVINFVYTRVLIVKLLEHCGPLIILSFKCCDPRGVDRDSFLFCFFIVDFIIL